ncbi:DUF257 family protein [Thermococcus sibiricus]|uniref:Uncharacterized protein n=1 Tax=Thermococcus sibiricus (strain DSM 12597 / MM 739) TaxID=604354 RepID=C6A1U0_THESM|nr:DUF257 family protein [Thermococcus sibiricus]ACS89585.1 hypothetical protein TSIB_0519 [Thermococcus sibiricus MM 739]
MIRVRDILDNIQLGETVLIEYSSKVAPILFFSELVDWAKEKGYSAVVDDILDTLYLYKVQLELVGANMSFLNDLKVIKFGGRFNVGQIFGRLHIERPEIREQKYKEFFGPLLEEGKTVVNPVLGFEKIFLLQESKADILNLMNETLSFVGEKPRIALYFINSDVLESTAPEALPLFEELASTILKVDIEGKLYKFSVVKSVNNNLLGLEFTLP